MAKRKAEPPKNPAALKQPPKQGQQARNYCFRVSFGEKKSVFFRLLDPDLWDGAISYCIYQLECGADGTLHYQGYLECVGKKSYVQLHKLEGLEGAWFGVRKGTGAQAIAYCKKRDETYIDGPWEWGEEKQQGKRSDLEEMKRKIDDGAPITRLWEENFPSMVRYHKSFQEYKRVCTKPRDFLTQIIILWGPSRSGKSVLARQMAPAAYWKSNSKWWCDYDGESAVVWDDFCGQYPYRELIRLLDSTPIKPEAKGSSRAFIGELIIFTSNFHPRDWYNGGNVGHNVWEESPLACRIREYGTIIYLGPDAEPQRVLGVSNALVTVTTDNTGQRRLNDREHPGDQYGLPRIQGG